MFFNYKSHVREREVNEISENDPVMGFGFQSISKRK